MGRRYHLVLESFPLPPQICLPPFCVCPVARLLARNTQQATWLSGFWLGARVRDGGKAERGLLIRLAGYGFPCPSWELPLLAPSGHQVATQPPWFQCQNTVQPLVGSQKLVLPLFEVPLFFWDSD